MIRHAELKDLEQIVHMLKAFASASIIDYSDWSKADIDSATVKIVNMIKREYLLVAEHNDTLVGMIGAVKEQDYWFNRRTRLRELFWWVDPLYRRSRLSAELYLRWENDVERYLRDKLVDQVSLSTQPGSSNIDPAHRGWICVEQHWIKG